MAEGDMDTAEVILKESLKNALEYHEGNEDNDLMADPYLYLSQIQMSKN